MNPIKSEQCWKKYERMNQKGRRSDSIVFSTVVLGFFAAYLFLPLFACVSSKIVILFLHTTNKSVSSLFALLIFFVSVVCCFFFIRFFPLLQMNARRRRRFHNVKRIQARNQSNTQSHTCRSNVDVCGLKSTTNAPSESEHVVLVVFVIIIIAVYTANHLNHAFYSNQNKS